MAYGLTFIVSAEKSAIMASVANGSEGMRQVIPGTLRVSQYEIALATKAIFIRIHRGPRNHMKSLYEIAVGHATILFLIQNLCGPRNPPLWISRAR